MRDGLIDIADIGPCFRCGRDRLRVYDVDGMAVDLEPWSTWGEDVAVGWYWRTDTYTPIWAVHIATCAEPGAFAFFTHYCEQAQQRKGTPKVTTATDLFGSAAAPGSSGPDMKEIDGKLVLFTLHAIERGIITSNGPADAAKGELVDLTSGETWPSHAMWGKVIVPQFASAAPGTRFVGRVIKGTPTGTQSPPWTWVDGSEDDKAVAVKYLTFANGQAVNNQAAPPAAPAAPAAATPLAQAPAAAAAPDAAKPPWL